MHIKSKVFIHGSINLFLNIILRRSKMFFHGDLVIRKNIIFEIKFFRSIQQIKNLFCIREILIQPSIKSPRFRIINLFKLLESHRWDEFLFKNGPDHDIETVIRQIVNTEPYQKSFCSAVFFLCHILIPKLFYVLYPSDIILRFAPRPTTFKAV